MTIEFQAIEFDNAHEAIQYADADGGRAISMDGKRLALSTADAERLEGAGIEFAYLVDHEMPDGTHRIMTIPVND